ncbi:MAG: flagellar biosynthetic protein FliO [Alphaproteobacteria bacterium]|nr:flagellar biosynthetic protein FliO [Alphaproteobacteria bacterium]
MNEPIDIFKVLLAFSFVLALLGGLAFVLRYMSARGFTLYRKGTQNRRLKIVETLPLDARRRCVIVRCDATEHLLLLGNDVDLVIENSIPPPKPPVSRGQNTP